jgi:exosome complex component RRP4
LQLNAGQLVTVAPYLVKRQKQHFHHLEQYDIDLILGCNGFIWIGEHVEAKDNMVEDQANLSDLQNYDALETRKHICRAANAVKPSRKLLI